MERAEQEVLLDSYRSAREGRLERWRYRMRVAQAAAAYKEGDEAAEALSGEPEDKAGSDESPLRWRRRGPAPPRPRGANNEAEDITGSAEAPPCRQRGGDFPRSTKAPPAGNETEDIAGSAEAPPRCQCGRATQKTTKSRTR